MHRIVLATLLAVPFLMLAPAPAQAGQVAGQDRATHVTSSEVAAGSVFTFRDGRLVTLLQELERTSPTAAHMLRTLREFGVPVVFGTVETVLPDLMAAHRGYDPGRAKALGFMAPVVRPSAPGDPLHTDGILVGLDLDRLDVLFGMAKSVPRPFDVSWAEIQRFETLALLGHEIVHAYGLAAAGGDPRRGCLDPRDGESPRLSCVVVGENVIRREIGAPLDWGYGLGTLTDLPPRYAELKRRRAALRDIGATARRILRTHSSDGRPAD